MTPLILIFIILQIILLFFITLHDWVHVPPLTDIRELEKHSTKTSRLINSAIFFAFVFIPLLLTITYQPQFPRFAIIIFNIFYGLLTLGTIFSWWVPYFFGSFQWHKEAFAEYKNTHHFLPKRGDNVVPNTFHVLLHLQIWSCFSIALYLLMVS